MQVFKVVCPFLIMNIVLAAGLSCTKTVKKNNHYVDSNINFSLESLCEISLDLVYDSGASGGIETITFINKCSDSIYISSPSVHCAESNYRFALMDNSGNDLYADLSDWVEYIPVKRSKKCKKKEVVKILPNCKYKITRIVNINEIFRMCEANQSYNFIYIYIGKIWNGRKKLLVENISINSNEISVKLDNMRNIQINNINNMSQ